MDRLWSYLGGAIGGYALTITTLESISLEAVDPVLDIVGSLAIIVFGVALIVHGVRTLIKK